MKTFLIEIFLIAIMIQFSCRHERNFPLDTEIINSTIDNARLVFNQLEKIKWKDSLFVEDIEVVLTAIDSSKLLRRDYANSIIIPILIHRFNISKERVNLSRLVTGKELLDLTENKNDKEFDEYLYSLIIPECLVKNLKQKITHYHCKGDDYLNALVIRQCKLLRNGKKPNIEIADSLLNKRQEYLLQYSQLDSNLAIEKLHKLAKVYGVKNNTYHGQISWTLSSYGRIATIKSYSIFMDKNQLKEFSEFGKYIISQHLSYRALIDLNENEILKLNDRISLINIQNEKLEKAEHRIKQLKRQFENK